MSLFETFAAGRCPSRAAGPLVFLLIAGGWCGETVRADDVASASPLLTLLQDDDDVDSVGSDPELWSVLDDTDLELRFIPGVWLPRLGGSMALDGPAGQPGTSIEFEEDLALDGSEATFLGEMTLRKGDAFTIRASGFAFATEVDGRFQPDDAPGRMFRSGNVVLQRGDRYESSFEMSSFEAEFMFKPWFSNRLSEETDLTGGPVDLRLSPTVGLRGIDVRYDVQELGPGRGKATLDKTYAAPTGGLSLELDWMQPRDAVDGIVDRMTISIATSLGPMIGAGSGGVWNVRAGVHVLFTPQLGVMFGYRLVELDVDDDDYEFDGGLQGLFLAGSFRF